MTIEQEARHTVKYIEVRVHPLGEIIACKLFSFERCPPKEQKRMVQRCVKAAIEYHDKALKVKQDRIEVLEKKLELEEEELARWQDSAFRLEGNLDTALSTIETLESALKEIAKDEFISEDCLHAKTAKKALGGGA